VLGQFVEIGVGEAEAGPVDIETADHRMGEVQRDVRCHRLGVGVRLAGLDQQAQVFVLRQPLEGGGDGFGYGIGRIGDALQVSGQPVEEAAGGVHGCRDE